MNWINERLSTNSQHTVAFIQETEWSYQRFLETIAQISSSLPLSQPRIIAFEASNPMHGLACVLAIAATNHIALPILSNIPDEEKKRLFEVSKPNFQIEIRADEIILRSLKQQDPVPLIQRLHGSGLILFTSGTSGAPKAMLHNLNTLLDRYQAVRPRKDITLQLLPIDHIGGLDSALRTILSGSTLIHPNSLAPSDVAKSIAKHGVTVLPASPTFLNLLLLSNAHREYDCSTIEIIAYGAEPMPEALLARLHSTFPKADLQQKFGTSETGTLRIKSLDMNSTYFEINDRDTEWKIIENELWLKSPSRILGYINANEDSIEADGWYRTGDLVENGPGKSLRILGRKSSVINVGGFKVHPSEVESIIAEIPEVIACKVYKTPDPIAGNKIACQIVSQAKHNSREWKRIIRKHCLHRMAAWKIPSTIILSSEIDITSRLKKA